MPAIFYREAFHAAVGGKSQGGIGDEHFTKWEKPAEALNRFCSEPVDLTKQVCRDIAQAHRQYRISFHQRHMLDSPLS